MREKGGIGPIVEGHKMCKGPEEFKVSKSEEGGLFLAEA